MIFKLSFHDLIIREIPIETIYFNNKSNLNPFVVILPFLFRHFKNYIIRLKNEFLEKNKNYLPILLFFTIGLFISIKKGSNFSDGDSHDVILSFFGFY